MRSGSCAKRSSRRSIAAPTATIGLTRDAAAFWNPILQHMSLRMVVLAYRLVVQAADRLKQQVNTGQQHASAGNVNLIEHSKLSNAITGRDPRASRLRNPHCPAKRPWCPTMQP